MRKGNLVSLAWLPWLAWKIKITGSKTHHERRSSRSLGVFESHDDTFKHIVRQLMFNRSHPDD